MLKLAQLGRLSLQRLLISPATSSFLSSSPLISSTLVAPFSVTSVDFAKKKRRNKNEQKIEVVDIEDDDDDADDDVIDEKTAMKAKGILHPGVGEAEEIVDDGLPKDYKHRTLKLASRRIDTLLNRTSGKSSAYVYLLFWRKLIKLGSFLEKLKK